MVGRMELAVVLGLWIAGVGMLPSCIQPPAPRGGFLGCFLGSPSPGPYESSTALAGTWGGGDGPTAALHLGGPRRCRVGAPSAIKNAIKTPVALRFSQQQGQGGTGGTPTTPRASQLLVSLLLQEHPCCWVGVRGPRMPGGVVVQWDGGAGQRLSWLSPSPAGTDMAVFCLLCGKRFQTQSALQQHMEVHAGVRSYICSECNRTFPSHTALKRHLRSHTGMMAPPTGACHSG